MKLDGGLCGAEDMWLTWSELVNTVEELDETDINGGRSLKTWWRRLPELEVVLSCCGVGLKVITR